MRMPYRLDALNYPPWRCCRWRRRGPRRRRRRRRRITTATARAAGARRRMGGGGGGGGGWRWFSPAADVGACARESRPLVFLEWSMSSFDFEDCTRAPLFLSLLWPLALSITFRQAASSALSFLYLFPLEEEEREGEETQERVLTGSGYERDTRDVFGFLRLQLLWTPLSNPRIFALLISAPLFFSSPRAPQALSLSFPGMRAPQIRGMLATGWFTIIIQPPHFYLSFVRSSSRASRKRYKKIRFPTFAFSHLCTPRATRTGARKNGRDWHNNKHELGARL